MNITVTLDMPFNATYSSTLTKIQFVPTQEIPTDSKYLVGEATGLVNFALSPVSGENGYEYKGQFSIVVYSSGDIGGVLVFTGTSDNEFNVTIPDAIPVQSEIVTAEYTTNQTLVSLELIVIVLIAVEIVIPYLPKRDRDRNVYDQGGHE
jgi:hypothetical protein